MISDISFKCQYHIKHKLQLLGLQQTHASADRIQPNTLFVWPINVKKEVDLKKEFRLMGEKTKIDVADK